MRSFIADLLHKLKIKETNFSEITFIVPSIRAGIFLKNELTKVISRSIFSPEIVSIEDFTQELSGLKLLSNTELLFEFYKVYLELTEDSARESFEAFSKWAQILVQDFNEVDRYLIPQEEIFNYLSAIQDLKIWYREDQTTEFIKQYITFWNRLIIYYNHFTERLLKQATAYQGLIYRHAVYNLEDYIQNTTRSHVFVGFNALNQAEERIFQELLQNDLAQVYWDIDEFLYNHEWNDAGMFLRQYNDNWPYYSNHDFEWFSSHYKGDKNIVVHGVPKNVSQAKQVGLILNDGNMDIKNTAVILADEKLLLPVLNSLPDNINEINITMGLSLRTVPMATLFESIFYLHKATSGNYYYKDVIAILNHEIIQTIWNQTNSISISNLIDNIYRNNITFLTYQRLIDLTESNKIIKLIFSDWENQPQTALKKIGELIYIIKEQFDLDKDSNKLNLEFLFRFNNLFDELKNLQKNYGLLNSISSVYEIYRSLLSLETVDFVGEPLDGLQVMGMLESRVLDFENIIITSVNEGILPAGKSQNSFIPYDLKLQFGLPTFKEKDAIYTYHFYRLLQRAKNVHIIYNTEVDALSGGEKSRLVRQLELDSIHPLKYYTSAPKIPIRNNLVKSINKDSSVLQILQNYTSENGFSPSSLTSYIRNPFVFYKERILKVKEYDDVEETIAANTLGTVVHNTLEDFYKPFVGSYLNVEHLNTTKSKIEETVSKHFLDIYKEGEIKKGKNLIIFEIAKRYVSNFLDMEIDTIQKGNTVKILSVEDSYKIPIQMTELSFPVFLTGKVDRIDEFNGTVRIIDYKSGKVEPSKVKIQNWEDVLTDYDKYSKAFQVLCYASMVHHNQPIQKPIRAGIISFKNLGQGFMEFQNNKNSDITAETVQEFQIQLKNLILEIFDLGIPFMEKD